MTPFTAPPFHPNICKEYGFRPPDYEEADKYMFLRKEAKKKYELDFAWIAEKFGVEINGGIWRKGGGAHTGTGHLRDMRKLNLAQEHGWVILQYEPGKIDYKQVGTVLNKRS